MNYDLVNSFIGEDWVYATNDCFEVVRKVSKAVFGVEIKKIPIPRKSNSRENKRLFLEHSKRREWVKVDKPSPGDIALFLLDEVATHIGIFITPTDIMHCRGTPRNPGKTSLDRIADLKLAYDIDFYEYSPNNDN